MSMTLFSAQPYDRMSFDEVLARTPGLSSARLTYREEPLSAGTAVLAEGSRAACVFVNDIVDGDALRALKAHGVEAVLLRCAGFNNVDLASAGKLGIQVARVPAYSPEAVAEHTLALLMTLNRKTHRAYNRVREGNFTLDGLLGRTLHGKTVGLVGLGKIGLATARIMRGLGCRVLGVDPFPAPGFEGLGEEVELGELLAEADIVSLHCPLTPQTHHILNAEALSRMKPGAILINTSRGALIDTKAVIDALKSRQLGALAIDVYEQEGPLFFRDRSQDFIEDEIFARLMTFPNVLITGHQGFFTREALDEIASVTLANLLDVLSGRTSPNAILA
jgi:D-lactate dehydrogenase